MIRDFDGVNGLSRAYDIGYDDGYQKAKAEIDELLDKLSAFAFGKRKGLIHMDDVRKVLKGE